MEDRERQKDDRKDPEVRVVDRRWWARGESEPGRVADEATRKPTYVEELEKRVADQTAQLQQVLSDHRRSAEDFDQIKARMRRDVGREVERGRRALLVELLDVVDNLDRAILAGQPTGTAPSSEALEPFARGVALVRDQFLRKLEGFGVVRLQALGEPFDAERHEAVTTMPVEDSARVGAVVAVVREGYLIGDDLLRAASVVVGTAGA